MTKIHLDTDIGGDMDDLCALAMLLKWPDLEITAAINRALRGRRSCSRDPGTSLKFIK